MTAAHQRELMAQTLEGVADAYIRAAELWRHDKWHEAQAEIITAMKSVNAVAQEAGWMSAE